ncbi:hypothetical protein PR048_002905 [Dryococelus australis]|uniref:Uncharacterized protein n=1 Tax=Dryococelus australis TaxID=614101 RepID=A0ABQ9ILJ3_9NEOP|nr:hypothetical protein PR048_002905 [Dryococelus australis]
MEQRPECKGVGNEIPEKTRLPAASSGTGEIFMRSKSISTEECEWTKAETVLLYIEVLRYTVAIHYYSKWMPLTHLFPFSHSPAMVPYSWHRATLLLINLSWLVREVLRTPSRAEDGSCTSLNSFIAACVKCYGAANALEALCSTRLSWRAEKRTQTDRVSEEIWAALNSEVLRADDCEVR